eukprot:3162560-Rhodomonas_salina.1
MSLRIRALSPYTINIIDINMVCGNVTINRGNTAINRSNTAKNGSRPARQAQEPPRGAAADPTRAGPYARSVLDFAYAIR